MYICEMNTNLLRGSLDTIIIKLLNDNGEMYGYEITKMAKEMSQEKLNLTEGALYPALHKMEAAGILDVESRLVENRYRKYYKLTKKGKTEFQIMMDDMKVYLETMQGFLNSTSPITVKI